MELSALSAYAKEKYQIEEQHKWADFPGFSVLCHPQTGKWVALLMRQWDSESGTEVMHCDLKCGSQALREFRKSYLSKPVRMRGPKWVNITFDDRTEPAIVFHLFDLAVTADELKGYMIILDETPKEDKGVYKETPLPFHTSTPQPSPRPHDVIEDQDVPDDIYKMLGLYEYSRPSISHKAAMFYKQGKFMEHYEDDTPWKGDFRQYFTTYHDLNVRQLRGYFTWRTNVRKGIYQPIATSLAYLYLYELLNGIGTDSPEDALSKMASFETGFLDTGIGDSSMKKNMRRWMFEYAIIHNLPQETTLCYIDPVIRERDAALSVLKKPKDYDDEAIFGALCHFAGKKLQTSPVITKDESKGKHLFAQVWRYLSVHHKTDGKTLFTACFGRRAAYIWHPLANAVIWEEREQKDMDYVLNDCRSYHLRDGKWREKRYEPLHFDKELFRAIIHESDRVFRKALKTGHYLRQKETETWVTPYLEALLEAERQAEIAAAKPKVTINFSALEHIRQDASLTRDSLLIEEEDANQDIPAFIPEESQNEDVEETSGPDIPAFDGLDSLHTQILMLLLQERSIADIIKNEHLMPSIVTDTINEAMFDEIGDNILTCEGDDISLIEDYKEDIIDVLGGVSL